MKKEKQVEPADVGRADTQVPCPYCGGEGHREVTLEMAIDAGDRSMAGIPWGCSYCNGDGWILQEIEAENDRF